MLAVREFRALWLAGLQSLLGDQLARVALSVLTFAETGSGLETAAVYSLTFLPALFGTPLGALADRLPRRTLLIIGDLLRAGLLALLALPGLPLAAVMVIVFATILIGAPWKAAESALVADILAGEGYVLGSG
ncbi:MAG TPA: MFS transporter, partial [Jatrophihabitans sp.]|nr:MFS transporter [Jatrophihabitans sp.]